MDCWWLGSRFGGCWGLWRGVDHLRALRSGKVRARSCHSRMQRASSKSVARSEQLKRSRFFWLCLEGTILQHCLLSCPFSFDICDLSCSWPFLCSVLEFAREPHVRTSKTRSTQCVLICDGSGRRRFIWAQGGGSLGAKLSDGSHVGGEGAEKGADRLYFAFEVAAWEIWSGTATSCSVEKLLISETGAADRRFFDCREFQIWSVVAGIAWHCSGAGCGQVSSQQHCSGD